ncbi:cellulose synthase operon protein YhjQ [Vibrio sp. JC009]|uniref:cellulose biosynthesis protein BcsQ n=1 Tax=Vibrio sp. JC009 TaxID=2912314 RepID=UPI0023B1E38F|nr:cellulose biosynthesis protein BcsQ [Vibrio sp. JC009]WED20654.1 cellulose synthase operon protein YhjQ [Vibrio sp. JC009]
MPLITIYSPKGGVGKTTLTANLCYSFARQGLQAIGIDFDPQNALRLHFGVHLNHEEGYVPGSEESADWSDFALSYKNKDNLFVLPYGTATELQRLEFEMKLLKDETFLTRGLRAILENPQLIVIADLPPGPSAAIKAISPLTDLFVMPLLADSASLSLLPTVENENFGNETAEQYFLLNQVDYKRRISSDVTAFVQDRLKDKLLGVVHRDESVVEANALQKAIVDVNRASVAAFDIEDLSKKIADILGVGVAGGSMFIAPM